MSDAKETIRSASNPHVKRLRAARRGKEDGVVVLEGERLCEEALRQGARPRCLLVGERRAEAVAALEARGIPARLVEGALFASLSSLTSAPTMIGLFDVPRSRSLADLPVDHDPLVVVAAGIQDPGNLGALARTAEAAGARALIVTPEGCRPWNEKALRGSMGSLLRLPVFESAAEAVQDRLRALGYRSVVARTRGGIAASRFDWSGRVALWFSSETGELPARMRGADAWEGVSIALAGGVESLNVTAAAAVLLFAAGRTEGEA